MNLTSKFTLAFTLLLALLLLSVSAWQLQRYLDLQARESNDDIALLGQALASAAAELWRLEGEDAARAYIERRDAVRARTSIIYTADLAGVPGDVQRALASEPVHLQRGDERLTAYVALDGPAEERRALLLERSLEPERRFVREAMLQQLVLTALFVLLSSVLTWVVGRRMIGTPLEQLITHARTVGGGELSSRLDLKRRSEFSVLAHEMNTMAERLERARAIVADEHQQRVELLDHLRHADRLSSIGKLAAAVGHELGTPLNVISGHASMIQMNADASPAITEHAGVIVERVRHMTRLISQMMNYARGRGIRRASVDVDATVRDAISFVRPLAERRAVSITIEARAGARLHLDVQRLLQVLTNLLVNAIQALPNGGEVRVGASVVDDVTAPADTVEATRFLRLHVEDDGVGMNEEQVEHALEPFFTTKEPGEGTGLGLSICDGIVREHGGWITLRSALGEGTRFECFFPFVDSE